MPAPQVRERIEQRLDELYQRHRDTEAEPASYYVSGRGYVSDGSAEGAAETFGVVLASMDGETFGVGDADVPFPLQSLSKVFVYGLALEDHGREAVHERVGVGPSGGARARRGGAERRRVPPDLLRRATPPSPQPDGQRRCPRHHRSRQGGGW